MPRAYITLSSSTDLTLSPGESTSVSFSFGSNGSGYSVASVSDIYVRNDTQLGGYFTLNGTRVPDGQTIRFFRDESRDMDTYDRGFSSLSTLEFHAGSSDFSDVIIVNGYLEGFGTINLDSSPYRTHTITTDAPDVTPVVSASGSTAGSVTEGQSVTYTVTLSEPSTTDVYVNYSLTGRGGNSSQFIDASDVSTSSSYFFIPAGQTQASVTITALADGVYDGGTEYYRLELTSASGNATIGSQDTFLGTIYDADSAPNAGRVSISANQSQVQEGDGASVGVSFTVTRANGSDGSISVPWSVSHGGTASTDFAGATSGTVFFGNGSTASQTITVYISGDTIDEDLYESFSVNLGSPSGGASLGTSSATVSIVDDDTTAALPGNLTITPAISDVTEGPGAYFEFNVDRVGGSDGEVTVEWYEDSSDTDSTDFSGPVSGTLTFADGVARQIIRIDVADDLLIENDESVIVRLVNPTGGAQISNGSANGTLTDNDLPGGFRDPVGDGTVSPQRGDDDSSMPEDGGDGWYDAQGFYDDNNHLASDWNSDLGGSNDLGFPIYAAYDGVVVDVIDPDYPATVTGAPLDSANWWRGQSVIIRHDLPNGEVIYTHYAHLRNVSHDLVGQSVITGQQIGEIGEYPDNNLQTAPHLHFEVRGAEDPNLPVLETQGRAYISGLIVREDQFGVEYVLVGNTRYYDPIEFINSRRDVATGSLETGGSGSSVHFTEEADSVALVSSQRATTLAGNDTVIGSFDNDTIMGGLGDDSLSGQSGEDLLRGDQGHDELSGGAASDTISGGIGNDTVSGDSGADRLFGSSGNDLVRGGDHNDTLSGGSGQDVLSGNDGNDLLRGDADNDRLFGGDGDDSIAGNAGGDSLIGGLGNDLMFGGAGQDTLDGGDGTDNLSGGSDDDQLDGGNDADRLAGDAGQDTIRGENGADRLDGGDGADLISGGLEEDTLIGGEGNDRLFGGGDNDLLAGNDGHDTLDGGLGADRLLGNDGNDHINGQDGHDEASGGNGLDIVLGRGGNDTLRGGNQNDRIYGGTENDLLSGNNGNDALYGGSGNDRMFGGANNDTLTGNGGQDSLTGGSGADVFVFNSVSDSAHGAARDTITDFQSGLDRIDLSELMSGLTFIGTDSYSGSAGEVRYNSEVGRLYIDTDGDGASELSIDLSGAPDIEATDLIL